MLTPEQGGMLPPEDRDLTLDDYRRGFNQLVDTASRINHPAILTDEAQVKLHAECLMHAEFSAEELRHLLAWALVRITKDANGTQTLRPVR